VRGIVRVLEGDDTDTAVLEGLAVDATEEDPDVEVVERLPGSAE